MVWSTVPYNGNEGTNIGKKVILIARQTISQDTWLSKNFQAK